MVGASKPNTVPLELASVVMVARGEGTCLRGDLERENSVMRGEREEGREEGGGERERKNVYLPDGSCSVYKRRGTFWFVQLF